MKYFVFFVLILSLTSCSFFQGQTSVGEEKVQEMQEIFVIQTIVSIFVVLRSSAK